MKHAFPIVILVVAVFIGFMLGYSIPPFLQAGVFSDRAEKGVEVLIDDEAQKYYENLYKDDEEEEDDQ